MNKHARVNYRTPSGAATAAKILRQPAFIAIHNVQLVETFSKDGKARTPTATKPPDRWE